jgi:hypothetical protein
MKKDWEKPELIVIIKTELEEDVLASCKTGPHVAGCWNETSGKLNAYGAS